MVQGKMIYDCFMFFNEVELLELRLKTLSPIVDYFVLVEIEKTHTGKDKILYFEEFKELFKDYKIIHVKHPGFTDPDAWVNENAHRNLISYGIEEAGPEDYIMISDVDEIPDPEEVKKAIESGKEIFSMMHELFCFYVNCKSNQEWIGTVVTKKKHVVIPQDLRNSRHSLEFVKGGWHYSSMGGKERIRIKFESFAETDFNKDQYMNDQNLDECLETGKDLTGRIEEYAQKRFISEREVTHSEVLKWRDDYPNFWK